MTKYLAITDRIMDKDLITYYRKVGFNKKRGGFHARIKGAYLPVRLLKEKETYHQELGAYTLKRFWRVT